MWSIETDKRLIALNTVLDTFPNATAHIVGGAVRDILLSQTQGKALDTLEDVDITVTGIKAKTLADAVHQQAPEKTRCIPLDEDWGIYRVIFLAPHEDGSHTFLDIAQALGDDLHTDLARRDLSINAMAMHPHTGEVIDLFNGQDDLKHSIIRSLSQDNLMDDPLRLLRVFRFHSLLAQHHPNASIHPDTLSDLTPLLGSLHHVAGERLHVELLKLLAQPAVMPTLRLMAETGMLQTLFPSLRALACVPPNSHHHLPLWEHTLELVAQIEVIWPELDAQTQTTLLEPVGQGSNGLALLRLACLFHDVAKPHTWEVEDTGRHRFIGHEARGADLITLVLKQLKLSKSGVEAVTHAVRWHLYPCNFTQASSQKSVLKYFRKMGEHTPLVTVLSLVDSLATLGHAITPEQTAERKADHLWLLREFWTGQEHREAPPLLTGHEIMQHLKIPSGPQIGKVLTHLKEAQALGEITSKEEALQYVTHTIQPV